MVHDGTGLFARLAACAGVAWSVFLFHGVFGVGDVAAALRQLGQKARIESIEGAQTAIVQQGLALREVSAGEEVFAGERIRTDAQTKVTISYDDGSVLIVYPGSDLEIEKPIDGVRGTQLRSGNVQGLVQKAPPAQPMAAAKPGSKPKVKFVIRTKTAVMGVRGTEFVVGYNALSGVAQFNTLHGMVEVASSPAQLLGGAGVQVGGGQFVSATEAGISVVKAFEPSAFLSSLANPAAAGATSGATGMASSAAASGLASAAPGARSATAPPAPPPKLPPPPPPPALPPAEQEKKAAEAEKERPSMHLFSFGIGAFMSQNPNREFAVATPYYRAIQIHWTPSVPLPVLHFLYARGSFGATVFEHGSLNNAFLVHDYQALAGLSLFNPLFFEAGGGHQSWRSDHISGAVVSANTGLIISQNGRLNRVYGGFSKFFNGTRPFEIRAGVGIQIF